MTNTVVSHITDLAGAMAEAARDLLAMLSNEQRSTLVFPLDDSATRTDWGYFPRPFHGLPLAALDHRQQKAVHRFVATAFSLPTYATVTSIIALENVLDILEDHRRLDVRDPALYYLSLFGEPGSEAWAWQFEGHHVSINVTIAGGAVVSATPLFLGANPAALRHNETVSWRLLAEEGDLAHELLASFDRVQRKQAIISEIAPPDFVLMNVPNVPAKAKPGDFGGPESTVRRFEALDDETREALRFSREQPLGLPVAAMSPAQRARLAALIDLYVDRVPHSLAAVERAKLAPNFGEMHFAWAGGAMPGQPHYYRLQAPGFLVEYDNTQDNANHVHAVWRNPEGDFGADSLRDHLVGHHSP